jgi:hypothetical protein
MNEATNNPTEESIGIADSIFGSGEEETAGAGANPSIDGGEAAGKDGSDKGTPNPEKPAPEGTTGKKDAEQFSKHELLVGKEYHDFLNSQCILADGKLDSEKLLKNWRETHQYNATVNQALSNYKNQVTSLQSKTPGQNLRPREEVDTEFEQQVEGLKALSDYYANILTVKSDDPTIKALQEKAKVFQSHVNEEYKELKKEYSRNINQITKREMANELGLPIPGQDSITPEKAKATANENFAKHLKPQELADPAFVGKIVKPSQKFVHALAASMYPSLYDAANPNAPKSMEAAYRVMGDPEIASMIVDYGKSKIVAESAEKNKQEFGKAEYQRGRADFMKEHNISNESLRPNDSAVKKMVDAGGETDTPAGVMASMMADMPSYRG